ncbi:uncharacterized protein LOC132185207 [Corylus avellana]|uniref:uncharacterized protein LOC132185207 n=1 Tax=Corylus avellana TaxID=13451 RepID=UPI00286A3E56|nr:uncharacterized protein LOC132185207 [Corylus avellana]
MGIGVIIRDSQGLVSAALSFTREGFPEPTTAKSMGALCAVEFCRDLGMQNIIFEGDVEVVVKAINVNVSMCSSYGQIIEDIIRVLAGFKKWEVLLVQQEANEATHGLAKLAAQEKMEKVWIEEIPNSIYSIVTLEHFALFV